MNILVWFREDLRLSDNQALSFAAQKGNILPAFLKPSGLGGASKWWLHHSLVSLAKDLKQQGAQLNLYDENPKERIAELCQQNQIDLVVWNRVYSPEGIELGRQVKQSLEAIGVEARSFAGQLLHEPQKILNQQSKPYKVFTPYWKRLAFELETQLEEPLPVPQLTPIADMATCSGDSLDAWQLLPLQPNWAQGWEQQWQIGERAAQQALSEFLDHKVARYSSERDFPSKSVTSLLSPHLRFGEISPRQCFWQTKIHESANQLGNETSRKFLTELGWREFSRYLLFHFPTILDKEFNPKFEFFEWADNQDLLRAWQQGLTGYPLVDAGMRELWQTGYMHNRVRMVVASFLIKHLGIDWRHGMQWFWDTLLDADIANNTASWQWVAGCGADAAPYFRIFNPIVQSQKFDAQGHYLRRWLPELKALNAKQIHTPWEISKSELAQAGVNLGVDYPLPIVDHPEARQQALQRYKNLS